MMARKKPCYFCETEQRIDTGDGLELNIEFYPENGMFSVTSDGYGYSEAHGEQYWEFKYCPMCGRKLMDK